MTDISSLTLSINKDIIHSNILDTDEGQLIYAKIPSKYEPLQVFPEIAGLTKLTIAEMQEHFADICGDGMRISYIEGLPTGKLDYMNCNHCQQLIDTDSFRHCRDCYKDMCNMCFSETSEKIAHANGAKNWNERKDSLVECRKHTLVTVLIPQLGTVVCDKCDKYCSFPRYSNRKKNYDCCVECYAKKLI